MFSDTMMLGGSGRKAAYPVENSLLFHGGQSLSRMFSAGNRQTWTRGGFIRLADLTTAYQVLFSCGASSLYLRAPNGRLKFFMNDSGVYSAFSTTDLIDPTAWSHWHFIHDTTQEVATDRYQLWWNGVRLSLTLEGGSIPSRYSDGAWNKAESHTIGWASAHGYLGGYLAEEYFLDGVALPPGGFGETDPVTGSWRPRKATGLTFGANGFHLGKPWNSASLGTDYSGQGNNWTASGFVASDVVVDTPTNVFATLNPLDCGTAYQGLPTAGNLSQYTTGSGLDVCAATVSVNSGKWFIGEFKHSITDGAGTGLVRTPMKNKTIYPASEVYVLFYNQAADGEMRTDTSMVKQNTGAFGVCANTDVYGMFADINNNLITVYKNGALMGTFVTTSGSNPLTLAGYSWAPAIIRFGYADTVTVNFGQKPLAHAYTSMFTAGYKTLCTQDLPPTTGAVSGSFIGNVSTNGPFIQAGAVPTTLTINGNAVIWGAHADKLATGFKIITASTAYNSSGTNTWTATYNKKPSVGSNHTPATAQANP